MVRKSSRKSVKRQRNVKERHYVVIDYPEEKELLSGSNYTVRIGASESDCVEVSIDGGEWTSCRQGEGFWWFDWYNYPTGSHEIRARIRKNNRTLKSSIVRHCKYQT